jgi:uncharacterized OB-fold protein
MTGSVGFDAMSRPDLVWSSGAEIGDVVQLRGSRCASCDRVEFPSLEECPACGGEVTDVALGPDATLRGVTEVLHAPPDALVAVPYTVVIGEFARENLGVMGLLEEHVATDALSIGHPLEVCVVAYGGRAGYGFRLASGSALSG